MVAATLRQPWRAFARLSLRIYPICRRLTKVQAAILLAILLGEVVAFGALVGASAGERGATIRPPAVTAAGVMGTGQAAVAVSAQPVAVGFTPYTPVNAVGAAVAEPVSLLEEPMATGDAAR
jgi:hypothetical protein